MVSSGSYTSLVLELSEDEDVEEVDEESPDCCGGGGGIPPCGFPPPSVCCGLESLSAVISSDVLKLPSLFVSSLLKISAVDELLLVPLLLELDACTAVLNSELLIPPLLSLSIEVSSCSAIASKSGFAGFEDDEAP